jgi:hypothetical protein
LIGQRLQVRSSIIWETPMRERGLLRRATWARRVMYPLLTGYTLLGASVAAMALVMNLNADPDASLGLAAGFVLFAAVSAALTVALYRPLARGGAARRGVSDPQEGVFR